nr:MAG TPA: hypothetical protein [Caudoviricetes sp.]
MICLPYKLPPPQYSTVKMRVFSPFKWQHGQTP